MVRLKDLVRIMPNPTEFYLYIHDEHDNEHSHPGEEYYCRCVTSDFKTIWFRDYEDDKDHPQDRTLELLEYEVTCIRVWNPYSKDEVQSPPHAFYIFIDKPLKKGKNNG